MRNLPKTEPKMTIPLTFMVVDDDLDDCDFFREAVSEIDSSHLCVAASNGEDALMKLRTLMKPLPDFIFLDLNMHLMDGRRLLAELKGDQLLSEIPVIILTTSTSQRDKDDTYNLGAAHFITKPSEYQKLRKDIVLVIGGNWRRTSQISHSV